MALKKQTKPEAAGSSYDFPQKLYGLHASFASSFFKPQPEALVHDQIVIIDHFFTEDFCNELIASFESSLHLETTPLIKSKYYAARYNDRASVQSNAAANALWKYLRAILTQTTQYEDRDLEQINRVFCGAKNLNPQLRIYRYCKGHHFGRHYDESVTCPLADSPDKMGKTKWTLLIYLTGDNEFEGGGTIFYPDMRNQDPLNVHPSKGMALLHKHGDDCLQHEGELVKNGVKWVLRSDIVF